MIFKVSMKKEKATKFKDLAIIMGDFNAKIIEERDDDCTDSF